MNWDTKGKLHSNSEMRWEIFLKSMLFYCTPGGSPINDINVRMFVFFQKLTRACIMLYWDVMVHPFISDNSENRSRQMAMVLWLRIQQNASHSCISVISNAGHLSVLEIFRMQFVCSYLSYVEIQRIVLVGNWRQEYEEFVIDILVICLHRFDKHPASHLAWLRLVSIISHFSALPICIMSVMHHECIYVCILII